MKRLLPILLIIISLEISAELECSQYSSGFCGNFNNDFTLKCQKFSTCQEVQVDSGCKLENDKCVKNDNTNEKEICKFYDLYAFYPYSVSTLKMCKKVLIDDECEVNDNYDCQAKSSNSNVKCDFNDNFNHCKKYVKECTDYTDNNCGGLKTEVKEGDTQQCILLPSYPQCSDITIDQHCKVVVSGNTYDCKPRSTDSFDNEKYKCELNKNLEKPECKRRDKVCKELDLSKCGQISNCKATNYNGQKECRLVTIDSGCKINDNGDCETEANYADYQQCSLITEDYENYKCKATIKYCSKITNTASCGNGATIDSNNKCMVLTIGNSEQCVETKIHTSCKIEDKQCTIKTANSNQACKLNSITNGYYCQFYQKDDKYEKYKI